MGFECSQCGTCCHHLGQVYTILQTREKYSFLVRNQYTGDHYEMQVDPDKQTLFDDATVFLSIPEACPFFRYGNDEKAYCTAHLTRPGICRDYGCWRLLILDHRNNPVGKIKFARTFCSENPTLIKIWKSSIDELSHLNDSDWEREMVRRLARAGYRVLR